MFYKIVDINKWHKFVKNSIQNKSLLVSGKFQSISLCLLKEHPIAYIKLRLVVQGIVHCLWAPNKVNQLLDNSFELIGRFPFLFSNSLQAHLPYILEIVYSRVIDGSDELDWGEFQRVLCREFDFDLESSAFVWWLRRTSDFDVPNKRRAILV